MIRFFILIFISSLSSQELLIIVDEDSNSNVSSFEIQYIKKIMMLAQKKEKRLTYQFKHLSSVEGPKYFFKYPKKEQVVYVNQITSYENSKTLDFSLPYLPIQEALIVLKNSSLKKLSSKLNIACYKASGVPGEILRLKKKHGFQLSFSEGFDDWMPDLISGKIDAYFDDNIVVYNNPKKLRIFKEYGKVMHLAFVYRKNSILKKKLDPFIKYFNTTAKYFKLLQKHFGKAVTKHFQKTKSQ